MSTEVKAKDLDKAVKSILNEESKKDSMVVTSSSGVGLSLSSEQVKKALLCTIKNSSGEIEINKYLPTAKDINNWLKDFEKEAWEFKPRRINPESDLIVFDSKMVQAMWVGYFAGRKAGLKDMASSLDLANERIAELERVIEGANLT